MWKCPYTVCVYPVALVEESYLISAWPSYRICWEQSPSISWVILPPTNHPGRRHGCRWSSYSHRARGAEACTQHGLACMLDGLSSRVLDCIWFIAPLWLREMADLALLGYHGGSELAIQLYIFFSWGSLHSSVELCLEQVILSGYSTWAGEHIGVVTEIQLGFKAVSVCFLPFSRVKYVYSSWVESRLTAMLSVPLVLKLTKGIYPTSVWPQGWATQ